MNDITALAQRMKGQAVNAPYYLAECMNCGEMMPSSKLVESKNYPDGDADCYCPHCNADDCDIADLGNGEEPSASAWNFQQKRIDALVEALEKAQQDSDGVAGMAEHYETTISMLKGRIAELEESNAQVIQSRDHYKHMSEEGLKQLAESRTVTVKLPTTRLWAGATECYEKTDVITAIREAGGEISND